MPPPDLRTTRTTNRGGGVETNERVLSVARGGSRDRRWGTVVPVAAQRRSAGAECAGEQGKFWQMHDQLFNNHQWAQTGKNPRSMFRDFARASGLDLDKYDACMDGQRYAARLDASIQEGDALGVRGTPSFFVKG